MAPKFRAHVQACHLNRCIPTANKFHGNRGFPRGFEANKSGNLRVQPSHWFQRRRKAKLRSERGRSGITFGVSIEKRITGGKQFDSLALMAFKLPQAPDCQISVTFSTASAIPLGYTHAHPTINPSGRIRTYDRQVKKGRLSNGQRTQCLSISARTVTSEACHPQPDHRDKETVTYRGAERCLLIWGLVVFYGARQGGNRYERRARVLSKFSANWGRRRWGPGTTGDEE